MMIEKSFVATAASYVADETHDPGSIVASIFDKASRYADAVYVLQIFPGRVLSFIDWNRVRKRRIPKLAMTIVVASAKGRASSKKHAARKPGTVTTHRHRIP